MATELKLAMKDGKLCLGPSSIRPDEIEGAYELAYEWEIPNVSFDPWGDELLLLIHPRGYWVVNLGAGMLKELVPKVKIKKGGLSGLPWSWRRFSLFPKAKNKVFEGKDALETLRKRYMPRISLDEGR